MSASPQLPSGLEAGAIPAARSTAETSAGMEAREPRPPQPLFRGRGRLIAAAVFPIGATLQVLEFAFEDPKDHNADRVAYWLAHPSRVAASLAVGTLAVPFLIAGFGVLVALCWQDARRLAVVAGGFLTCAMAGLAGAHGIEMTAYGLARGKDPAAAIAALDGKHLGAPGVVLFLLFVAGAVFGVLTLVVALWRSRLVPRLVPVLVLGFGILDFVLQLGITGHVLNLAASLLIAAALVAGYTRPPKEPWWPLARTGNSRAGGADSASTA